MSLLTETRADTLPPNEISDELAPTIAELGLEETCRQLVEEGYAVIENVSSSEFNERLREAILRVVKPVQVTGKAAGMNMLLLKDPLFGDAIINPKLMAMAEFSVGRGYLISQVTSTVTPQGAGGYGLHADQVWLPAPFSEHNMNLTFCWVTDGYSAEQGATLIVPGSHRLRRHPTHAEMEARGGVIPIECPPNSVAMWDGRAWHSSSPRTAPGERVVCHISCSRLAMRVVENYSAHADELIERHGERMAQLLGRNDSLDSPTGFRYENAVETFNNSRI